MPVPVHVAIFGALGPLVAGRAYPTTFLQPDGRLPVWPAIRYTIISMDNGTSLCDPASLDGDSTRVQVDVVTATHSALRALVPEVIAAMEAIADPPCERDAGGHETYDDETKTHRAILGFTLHASAG